MPAKLLKRCLLLFMLSLNSVVNAMQVGAPTLSEAVVEAKFIFYGTVIDKQVRQADTPIGEARRRRIYVYYTFVINRVFKGSVADGGKIVTLRITEVTLPDSVVGAETIVGLPGYEIGTRGIMFMKINGKSMSSVDGLVLQYYIPPTPLIHEGEAVDAWFTPQGALVFKPDENTLREVTKNLKEGYERQKPTTESIEHYFRVIGSDVYEGELNGGILHPDGTWTLPEGAKPYDEDSYADQLGTLIKRALKKQALGGR